MGEVRYGGGRMRRTRRCQQPIGFHCRSSEPALSAMTKPGWSRAEPWRRGLYTKAVMAWRTFQAGGPW